MKCNKCGQEMRVLAEVITQDDGVIKVTETLYACSSCDKDVDLHGIGSRLTLYGKMLFRAFENRRKLR